MRRFLIAPLGLALALTTGCSWIGGGHRNSQANAGYTNHAPVMNTANAQAPTNQQVRDAQQKLQQLGLYKGPIDGIYGPQTVAAVHQFQSKNNLPQTGALNTDTRQRLAQAQAGQNQPQTAQAPAPNNESNNPPNNESNQPGNETSQPGNQSNTDNGTGSGGQNTNQSPNSNQNQ